MENNKELCLQSESSSLVSLKVEKDYEVLTETVTFLEEQIEEYELSMLQIRQQLEQRHMEYTYNNENNIVLDYDTLKNCNESTIGIIEKLQDRYNLLSDKTKRIKNNIAKIKTNFIERTAESVQNSIVDEISQSGLSVLNAQETERSRIACDLHDTVVQNLTSLIHKTELCIRTVDTDPIGVKLDLQIMIQNIRSTVDDIRAIIYNLRPMALEDLGLETAVRRYLNQFEQLNRVSTSFEYHCDTIELSTSVVSITLFRIIQESCSNAVKHGKAKSIQVKLVQKKDEIHLTIKDNGCGFDQNALSVKDRKDKTGFGLSIMKERVCLLAGQVMIDSKKGKGTTIQVTVPVKMC